MPQAPSEGSIGKRQVHAIARQQTILAELERLPAESRRALALLFCRSRTGEATRLAKEQFSMLQDYTDHIVDRVLRVLTTDVLTPEERSAAIRLHRSEAGKAAGFQKGTSAESAVKGAAARFAQEGSSYSYLDKIRQGRAWTLAEADFVRRAFNSMLERRSRVQWDAIVEQMTTAFPAVPEPFTVDSCKQKWHNTKRRKS